MSATVCARAFLGVGGGLIVEEEALDVVGVGFDVVGWQQDGAAGEPGFQGVVRRLRFAGFGFGAGGELRVGAIRFFLRLG